MITLEMIQEARKKSDEARRQLTKLAREHAPFDEINEARAKWHKLWINWFDMCQRRERQLKKARV